MIICDSHIHLVHCDCNSEEKFFNENDYFCVSNFCFKEEFERADENFPFMIKKSFGIHPQCCDDEFMEKSFSENLEFLKKLLSEKKIDAVGECGFDFFTEEFKSTQKNQDVAWENQLELSIEYGIPLIIHIRKAVDRIFMYSRELKKVSAVVFHSFPGTLIEANSILNHGINAFFSFGKPILNGKKSAIECAKKLPVERLLLETDAPYQTLKGEEKTFPSDILKVYEKVSELREERLDSLCENLFQNFKNIYEKP